MERVKNWQELEPGMYYNTGTGEYEPYVETRYFTKNEVAHLYHTHVRG